MWGLNRTTCVLAGAGLVLLLGACDGPSGGGDAGDDDAGHQTLDAGGSRDAGPPAPVDAGTDAGADAGLAPADAGPPDGGTDAGPRCTYFRDADRDRFGDPDAPFESDCSGPSRGYVRNSDDCDDEEPLANPLRDSFPKHPTALGSWDWNCDGTIELEYPNLETCTGDAGVPGGFGWLYTPIPDCGEVARFITVGCALAMRIQGCH